MCVRVFDTPTAVARAELSLVFEFGPMLSLLFYVSQIERGNLADEINFKEQFF